MCHLFHRPGVLTVEFLIILNSAKDFKLMYVLNTAKNDKGLDNRKPELKSFVVLCYGMVPSSLLFFAVFSRSI